MILPEPVLLLQGTYLVDVLTTLAQISTCSRPFLLEDLLESLNEATCEGTEWYCTSD